MSALPTCPDCGSQNWESEMIGNSCQYVRYSEAEGWFVERAEDS